MLLAARTRLGPYEILAPLGSGGMGEVYRARDTRLNRDVAVKVLPASFATDEDRLRRFAREAQAASALNHPNILAVFDIGNQIGLAATGGGHDGDRCAKLGKLEDARRTGLQGEPLGEPRREVTLRAKSHELDQRRIDLEAPDGGCRGAADREAQTALVKRQGIEGHALIGERTTQRVASRRTGVDEHSFPIEEHAIYHAA